MGMHPSMMALTVAGIIYILWKAQGAEACMPGTQSKHLIFFMYSILYSQIVYVDDSGNLNQGIHGLPTFKDTQETKSEH